jgi:hypothetical protein
VLHASQASTVQARQPRRGLSHPSPHAAAWVVCTGRRAREGNSGAEIQSLRKNKHLYIQLSGCYDSIINSGSQPEQTARQAGHRQMQIFQILADIACIQDILDIPEQDLTLEQGIFLDNLCAA